MREQGGVVVGRRSVDLDVVDCALALHLRGLGQGGALVLADLHVVVRHVVRRAAAGGQPVVVDRDDVVLLGEVLDGLAGARIQIHDKQDADAGVDEGLRL